MQNYHMRSAPVDPLDPAKGAKIGNDGELYNPTFGELRPRVMKNTSQIGAGFRILENKNKPKEVTFYNAPKVEESSEDGDGLTKDEILHQLGIEVQDDAKKFSNPDELTRESLRNVMVQDLTKQLDNLKRQKQGLENQKELITTGEVQEQLTREEKGERIKHALETEEGAAVIHAEPGRVQFERHQTGQLGGIGEYELTEVQKMRQEAQQKQQELEEKFWRYRSAKELGSKIMEKFFPNINQEEPDQEYET